jgi:hypothetical protein
MSDLDKNLDKIKQNFGVFLKNYDSQNKDAVWEEQSQKFRLFWNEKIMLDDNKDLNEVELDEIIRILDVKAKGNRNAEAIANVMIPQGAWYRMFDDIHKNKELKQIINNILTEQNTEKKAEHINKLYETNKGRKNNLTGPSGNAINALMAAFDPMNNLSIVSLKDRKKIIEFLYLDNDNQTKNTAIGNDIIKTNRLIFEFFNSLNPSSSARATSCFCYKSSFKNMWKDDYTDHNNITENVEHDLECNTDRTFEFILEKQLEDFLIKNWENTDLGKKYDLIYENDELLSQQFNTKEVGEIDILTKDKSDGRYVVIELKKNQTSDATVGQMLRYMGWVEQNLSKNSPAKGIIIASNYDKKLLYALQKVKGVELFIYSLNFNLKNMEYNK